MHEENTFPNNGLYAFGPFRLEVAERRLLRDGVPVPLSPKVFDLLLLFVEDAGHLKTREALIAALWPRRIVAEHGLTNKLHALRKALGDDGDNPEYIETIPGIGYRFIATVREEPKAKATSSGKPRPRRRVRLATALAALFVLVALIAAFTYELWLAPDSQKITSIAVLPFENLSVNDANAYFAAGIQDTILTRLTSIDGLRVTPRMSVKTYPSHPQNLGAIAEQLGVTAILEGSVQQDGKEVLINVQLIDAATSAQLWAANYTRTLDDVFNVEGEVAGQVATALSTRLRSAEMKRLTQPATSNPRAYVMFLKANYNADRVFTRSNTKDSIATAHQAVAQYKQAIALDPKFALVYARLSLLESRLFWFNPDGLPNQDIGPAREYAKRAIALDPNLPQAWMALGYATYYGDLDYNRALVQFQHAQKLLPNSAEIIGAIAKIHRRQGDTQSALNELQRAARLDPLNPQWRERMGITLMAIRRYDEAGRWLDQALALEPDDYRAMIHKATLALLTANTEMLERLAAKIPPDAVPHLVPELRFQAAYLAREPDRALQALDNAPVWLTSMNRVATLPSSLLKAEAWALKGNETQTRHFYRLARDQAETWLDTYPVDPAVNSALGLAEAALGNTAVAVSAGRHAVKVFSMAQDARLHMTYLGSLARIYAAVGEAKPAVQVLDRLFTLPAGQTISVPLLKASPLWDGIRNSPEFQALLKKYAPRGAVVVAQTPPAQ